MTKEQEIYKAMKRRGVFKRYGKWLITYSKMFCAVRDCGYSVEQTNKIIEGMIAQGYIRRVHKVKCRPISTNYVIERWESEE